MKEWKPLLTVLIFCLSLTTFTFAQTANYCPNLKYYQVLGSRDSKNNGETTKLQRFLKQNLQLTDYQFIVTGYFGRVTAEFVKQFQEDNNLYITGQVGAPTRAKIAQVCNITTSTTQSQNTQTQIQQTISNNSSNLNATSQNNSNSSANSFNQILSCTTPPTGCVAVGRTAQSCGTISCANTTSNTTQINTNNNTTGSAGTQTNINQCVLPTPSTETRTSECPIGQTGSISETRNAICQSGATQPSWSGWLETGRACTNVQKTATTYPKFANSCVRMVVDYVNGQNVLSPAPAWCTSPQSPLLISVTHESPLNTHWTYQTDGSKKYDANFVGDSAMYMHDYAEKDFGSVFKLDISPTTDGSGILGMALDTINFPGNNVTGRDFRNGFLFLGLNDLSVNQPMDKEVTISFSYRVRGMDTQDYENKPSGHRVMLGTLLDWAEPGRTNKAHYLEFNLYKKPEDFHKGQINYGCPSDGLTYDYCFYDSSSAGLYAEGKYISLKNVPQVNAPGTVTQDQWQNVTIPYSQFVRTYGWRFPPTSWSNARITGLYIGIESSGASRVWLEVKDYTVTVQ